MWASCGKNCSFSITQTNLCHCHRIRWWWFVGSRIRRSMEICEQRWAVIFGYVECFYWLYYGMFGGLWSTKGFIYSVSVGGTLLVWVTMNLDKVVTNSWTAVGLSESQLPVTFTGYCRLPGCCKHITRLFKVLSFSRVVVWRMSII